MPVEHDIILEHNLDPSRFMWLFARYVRGVNDAHHCTHVLRGPYSKRLSKHNPSLTNERRLVLDEVPSGSFSAIYICGVAKEGYRKHLNDPHNLHAAIIPIRGKRDELTFERWVLRVENGVFDPIPSLEELPEMYRGLGDEFVTCRIFRWAVCRGAKLIAT